MDVQCGNSIFPGQDVVVMIRFTDELDAVLTTGLAEWLRPMSITLDKALQDAIRTAMKGKGKQLKILSLYKEDEQ